MTLYFDHAATSFPKPPEVLAAATEFMNVAGVNPGRGSYTLARQAEEMVERTRRAMARFVNAPLAQRVIFGLNCTDALNMALHGVLRPGDRVLLSRLVHNSLRRPLLQLAERGEIELRWIDPLPSGLLDLKAWEAALQEEPVRLVACNHVSNVLGTIQPIAKLADLAHQHGALILVDAAQSAGVVPLDMTAMQLDLLAFSGHKGLQALPGVGVLCVGADVEFQRPWREGGTGTDSLSSGQPDLWPYFLEAGTPNLSGLASLESALTLLEPGSLLPHLQQHQQWRTEIALLLKELGGTVFGPTTREESIGTLSFTLPPFSPHILSTILDTSFSIAVRSGLHCAPEAHQWLGTAPDGTVRVSFGHSTTAEEINALKSALTAIAQSQTS
jgi:cysteine desulfurase family protein